MRGFRPPSTGAARARLSEFDRLQNAELFIAKTGAQISIGGNRAFYGAVQDTIQMPDASSFIAGESMSAQEAHYAALIRQLTHWTASTTRCNRDFTERFGDDATAMEELCADIAAAWLCSDLDLRPLSRPYPAAYPKTWLKVVRSDPDATIDVARKAMAAVDYLERLQNRDLAAEQSAEADHQASGGRRKAPQAAPPGQKGRHWTNYDGIADMPENQLNHARFDFQRWVENRRKAGTGVGLTFEKYVEFRLKKAKEKAVEAAV